MFKQNYKNLHCTLFILCYKEGVIVEYAGIVVEVLLTHQTFIEFFMFTCCNCRARACVCVCVRLRACVCACMLVYVHACLCVHVVVCFCLLYITDSFC